MSSEVGIEPWRSLTNRAAQWMENGSNDDSPSSTEHSLGCNDTGGWDQGRELGSIDSGQRVDTMESESTKVLINFKISKKRLI